ncbi:hypothetical protein PS627_01562 [Pseudomonas fluorescens]|uniref:DUF4880 domain-containing protein n=1 Tax=Pseudomonas fluorescens TaxID=294 RepID=UPI0012519D8A|nr:DUF4880 domain-containing protein [Pseudomonas fluorescens]CAG8865643.1 hypothetical protein PS627_01562 [Pseudomonas fluorescens]VVP86963.1 hypothetical protein PS910_02503 [Pseudomonas fluorescens]
MTRLLLPLEHGPQDTLDLTDDAVLCALRQLPRRVQQVFLLSRLDQLDFTRIAQRLDLPLLTLERHMNQVLQTGRTRHGALVTLAAQWYVRLQSPDVTACERIDFRRWLDAAPEHLQAFHQTELHWRGLLAPALMLGRDGWYQQGRSALTLGGCSVAIGLGMAALLALGFWA